MRSMGVCLGALLLAAAASAMAAPKLALSCMPVAETIPVGGPITVRITLRNDSGGPLEIPAVGLPWHSFYAATFTVKNRRDVERVLPEGVPLELPSQTLAAGASLSGEVDLGRYLQLKDRRSIAEVPGRYEVEAKVLSMAKPVGGADFADIKLRCGPFTVTVI